MKVDKPYLLQCLFVFLVSSGIVLVRSGFNGAQVLGCVFIGVPVLALVLMILAVLLRGRGKLILFICGGGVLGIIASSIFIFIVEGSTRAIDANLDLVLLVGFFPGCILGAVIAYRLEKAADVNMKDHHDEPPVHEAAPKRSNPAFDLPTLKLSGIKKPEPTERNSTPSITADTYRRALEETRKREIQQGANLPSGMMFPQRPADD